MVREEGYYGQPSCTALGLRKIDHVLTGATIYPKGIMYPKGIIYPKGVIYPEGII
jgi:hypothetical protein